ncbi:MAG TPA: nickel-dependent lactate racemase [bacterium]|nr:nickel-dependent lactate racemase [bacterium]
MKLSVPYGASVQEVDLTGVDVEVGRSEGPGEVDERAALESAFSSPVDSPSLSEFLAGADDAVVIVNDAKRATPTARILEFMRSELDAVPDITFIIATGTHRESTPEEIERIIGAAADREGARVVVHDGRDAEAMRCLGRTPRGTEVCFNRIVTDASRIVVVGSVEPHYFAGFTGGRKAFLPGVAGYETVCRNHSHTLLPGTHLMSLEGNPVHEDMMDALALMGDRPIFSVMVVMDSEHRICGAFAGDIDGSFRAAVERSRDVYSVDVSGKADIVLAVALTPADSDLYQAHKAIESSKLALVEGGVLILVAECREGFGNDVFVDQLRSARSLPDVARNMKSKPGGEYVIGDHKSVKLAELVMESEVWMVTDLPAETIADMFFRPFGSVQEALDAALELKGGDARVLCLMDAANTVPRLPQG